MASKDGPMPQVEITDPEAAFHRFEDFTRRVLAVPKKVIDRKLTKEKAKKKGRKP